jgi:DNA topoisomerase-1
MSKYLVVVESPTKVAALKKYLGKDYEVLASKGHVKDLPGRSLGVDVTNGFQPTYVTIPGREKILRTIMDAARKAKMIYLAPDPDREGEAIAYHIASELEVPRNLVRRVLIEEITKKGITAAIEHPEDINAAKFESQQARRILDRLVGYQISPLLWKKVKRGLSAGRVQSVAVRLICERESEIRVFNSEEYWTIDTLLDASTPPQVKARLVSVDGQKIQIASAEKANAVCERVKGKPVVVRDVTRREKKRNPVPPFTTSKLQQEAYRKLGFNVKRTMSVAQSLYEGVDVEGEGPVGLITYMRTDSTRLSDESIGWVRELVARQYGTASLPDKPNQYRTKKSAQDAHEAIRPTSPEYHPDKIGSTLSKDQLSLYRLIWNRFVACQMKPAIYDQMTAEFTTDEEKILLRASGSRLQFKGFLEVYEEGHDEVRKRADEVEEGSGEEADVAVADVLPPLNKGDKLTLAKIDPQQHFTQPPPRFNESSIVKELDERGIGRPSTTPAILSTIMDREYVKKVENRYMPTPLGEKVNELLVSSFPDIVNVDFTAQMEDNLDKVEEQEANWKQILDSFYGRFAAQVKQAEESMRNLKSASEPTDIKCDRCGHHFIVKWSPRGEFLGCSNYPTCRNTRELTRDAAGKIVVKEPKFTGDNCTKCGKPMVVRNGKFGEYIACSDYPTCPTVKSPQSDIHCPEKGCSGFLVPRNTRTGKTFWGCTNYPGCSYASWDKPINRVCKSCQFPIMVEKARKQKGALVYCPSCKVSEVGEPEASGGDSSGN